MADEYQLHITYYAYITTAYKGASRPIVRDWEQSRKTTSLFELRTSEYRVNVLCKQDSNARSYK